MDERNQQKESHFRVTLNEMKISPVLNFELIKLENKSRCYFGNDATLLESLILAQDERWRRA
jgi:hypothetical protein